MHNMLVQPTADELATFTPDMTILNAGCFPANRFTKGMTSSCSVDLHLGRGEMVILGTQYAGEMKKGVLTAMMYHMPLRGLLPLHSAANEGLDGGVTLFFGLSGTGKTTLSADPRRSLIGDDEHVWTDTGVFNVEGGCYAKCAHLSRDKEPEIFDAIRFGAVLENCVVDRDSRTVDYSDLSITENTRCAYPLESIPNCKIPALSPRQPSNVILLTCDGFGVLPPISKLNKEQVVYHFLNGYTSKMAGTEMGITSAVATFSSCYGEPFLVWHPLKYAQMLADKLEAEGASAWLLNTGWIGGAAHGRRCPLKYTRAMVDAVHSGELAQAGYKMCDHFNLSFPVACTGVPAEILDPAASWSDQAEYSRVSSELAELCRANFNAKYADAASPEVNAAGPPPPST
uniref:phosphoenolpyruvate carboxykinase (ATP) n=1 Tax=Calcidiscus leptoporus TaxID=127549 RepID=A0A7S0IVD8_9EUKA|mmetsp:Transcript_24454/g.56899  ORF Transcript_24454/g.56899 Transcript_24454/m.56899 type:complete len:400 (+) Transcript_24454:554-1753(+)